MADCNICKYRQFLANAYDMHIDHNDCDKVNTFFCEKMRKPETVVIIDAGCTDKTMYHKGFKDGYELGKVLCKDCTNWMYEYDDVGLCVVDVPDIDGVQRKAYDFCSYGERKGDGNG